jgi:hypothetical protein
MDNITNYLNLPKMQSTRLGGKGRHSIFKPTGFDVLGADLSENIAEASKTQMTPCILKLTCSAF